MASPGAPPGQPDSNDPAELREQLVAYLVREGAIRSPELERAFAQVPRELFLPPEIPLKKAYSDDAIVVKWDEQHQPTSSSTQPFLMADMLETLRLAPGLNVLEIGAGVGYNAAIMAHWLGDGAYLTSVDLDPVMAEVTRRNLQALAQVLGPAYERVTVVATDGSLGYPPKAPYDRIIVTVQQWEIAPAWVEQLKAGGLLLLPLTISAYLWGGLIPAFQKHPDGTLQAVAASHGGFMPMRGVMAHPLTLPLSDRGRLARLPLTPYQVLPGYRPPENSLPGQPEPRLYLSGSELSAEMIAFLEQPGLQASAYEQFELDFTPDTAAFATGGPAQRAASLAFQGFSMALAVAAQDRLFPLLLVSASPEEQDGLSGMPGDPASVRVRDGWRYEPRGLAIIKTRPEGYDLALVTANDPAAQRFTRLVQGWRLSGPLPPGGPNRAMVKLDQIWRNWQGMGRPGPFQYRPLAFPSDQPPPARPGYVMPRRYYSLLFPFGR